jgi:hypothetical protein
VRLMINAATMEERRKAQEITAQARCGAGVLA